MTSDLMVTSFMAGLSIGLSALFPVLMGLWLVKVFFKIAG